MYGALKVITKDMYKTKLSHDKIIMSEEIKARSKILNYHLF